MRKSTTKRSSSRRTPRAARRVPAAWRKLFGLIPNYDPIATAGPNDVFDAAEAELRCRFFPHYLRHIEGVLAGQPFELEPWQRAIVGCLFGWKGPDGFRRYRELLLYVARKNGKTPLCAGIALCSLMMDHEIGADDILAGASAENATRLFRWADLMIQRSPALSARLDVFRGIGQRAIHYDEEDSAIKVVSSDARTQHGGNGHLAVVDELHAQRNRELADVIETAMSSANRTQPLTVWITTADFEGPSICNEKYDQAKSVCSGAVKDRRFLPVVYELVEQNDRSGTAGDDWTNEKAWHRANPNLGVSVDLEYMRGACAKALAIPGRRNAFKRLHLNIRTSTEVAWLNMQKWLAAPAGTSPEAWRAEALERHRGDRCIAGLDLGSTNDLCAYVLMFVTAAAGPPADTPDNATSIVAGWNLEFDLIPFFWIPADGVQIKESTYKRLYEEWIERGFIRVAGEDSIDYGTLYRDILAINADYLVDEIAIDAKFQGAAVADWLNTFGYDVVEFQQGSLSMTLPTRVMEESVLGNRIGHGHNPVLNWMAGNAKIREYDNGAVKVVKPKHGSAQKVDGITAAIQAIGRYLAAGVPETSVYEPDAPDPARAPLHKRSVYEPEPTDETRNDY